jgi:hypothetical protein
VTERPDDQIAKAVAGFWNADPYDPATNPGGMDEAVDGSVAGHAENFPAALTATAKMAAYTGEQASLAGQYAASAAVAVEAMAGMIAAANEGNDLALAEIAAAASTAQGAAAAAVEASALVRGLEIGLAAGGYARVATISGASIEIGLAAGGWAVVSLT